MTEDAEWELTRENAHAAARAVLLDDFFWDCTDENSPFGNDTGADVLAFFHEWRAENPGVSGLEFLSGLLKGWEVADADWEVVDEAEVARLLETDAFSFTHRDESILALAFAQLALDGQMEAAVRERALGAVHRQTLTPALGQWAAEHRQERASRLESIRRALGQG